MSYDKDNEVELPDQEQLGKLLADFSSQLKELIGTLNPSTDDWTLEPGPVGVIFVPSNPPTTACIHESEATHHWMLQYPCGGIDIADLTTGTPTF